MNYTAVAAHSVEEFAKYAAYNEPDVSGFPDIRGMQITLARWETKMFFPTILERALGVSEEWGETIEAVEAGDLEKVLDGIGDIQVFVSNLFTAIRLDYLVVLKAALPHFWNADLHYEHLEQVCSENYDSAHLFAAYNAATKAVGRISHGVLKNHQRIRGFDDRKVFQTHIVEHTMHLLKALDFVVILSDIAVPDAFIEIGAAVQKRTWDTDPVTAGGHA